MAQEYNEILPSGSTNILQDNIDSRKNDETLRSGFSGSAFPISPVPVAGQRCYREDLKKEYIFNGGNWVEVGSSGTIAQEVTLARGTHTELQDRLGVSMNPDGTLKTPATANVDEFKVSGLEPTYVSTNSFSVPGDMRAIFTENRRLKITQGAETIYPAVVSSSYDNEADKTTIVIDNITITNEIAAVDFSMVQNGLPANLDAATLNGKADTAFQEVSQKDQPGGYAGLDANGKIDSEWIKDASETVKGVVELATPAEVLAGEDTERAVTPAGFKAAFGEFYPTGVTPTYVDANNFTVSGDLTAIFTQGRVLKITDTGGTFNAICATSAYDSGTGLTTVTVAGDTIDSGISEVLYAVSQHTGAIWESGSNANGNYVRYADGRQECTGIGTWTTAAVHFTAINPTMPASFPDNTYKEWGNLVFNSSPGKLCIVGAFSPTSGLNVYTVDRTNLAAGISATYRWMVVGRWY